MTLLHMDSLSLGDSVLRYSGVGSTRLTTSPRWTGVGYTQMSASGLLPKNFTAAATVISGVAFQTTGTQVGQMSFYGDAGATQHITIRYLATGTIEVRRGGVAGTLLTSASTGILHVGTWNFVEAKVTIADSGGIVEVRVNGSPTPLINFSGDTRNNGTNLTIDRVAIGADGQVQLADWYICDGLGSTNNDFLGDVRVHCLQPNANGNYSQLVGSDGNSTDNYLLVDESPYNTTDYVGSATVGQKDSYGLPDLPAAVSTVFGVQEVAVVAKSDAGAASIKQLLRASGTDYTTSAALLSTSYTELVNLRETNPATGVAWTPAGVNGAEIGVEVA